MERIHGVSLGRSYWSPDPERRAGALQLLIGLMVRLHSHDAHTILPDAPLLADPYAYAAYEVQDLEERVRPLTSQSQSYLAAILDWLAARRQTVPCRRYSATSAASASPVSASIGPTYL